ncbi:uncharacterized protein LOC113331736 [Papaver somniferum]|uniref:uncharacterized protein LOC113331736 n=1 Tax=Papaver somniferum TaxID=3469 RepID=UPI000E6FC7FB|nr:uncharacterized protein LOC113331736 [Papaver somniferum]
MDSIVSAALTEICSQGINGIFLKDLWPTLEDTVSSSGLSLCESVKTTIYDRLVKTPGLEFKASSTNTKKASSSSSTSDSPFRKTCSFGEAEKLGLRIVAAEHLRDSFVGLYDLKAADAGISAPQRRALERLARARSAGVTQSQLAKEFGMKGNNIFYVVRNLECQGLVVRQSTTVRTKESVVEGESVSNNTSIVHTNLIHLYRYAKHLSSQQKLEIMKGDAMESPKRAEGSTSNEDATVGDHAKEDVLVMDFLPALKAVCDKLEVADGKVLVVSDIKQALGYRKTPGHRAWRNICNRLKDAGLVEEFNAEVNRKIVSCMRLLKSFNPKQFEPKHAVGGADDFNSDQQLKFGNRGQVSAQIFELPIEHQIHDMIAAEGAKGITVNEILKRLGLSNKKYYTRLLNMFSRFGCHLQSESHNRSMLYRVWTSGNFTGSSLSTLPSKPTDVVNVVEPSSQSKKDLDLHDKSDEDMLQLDSLTTNDESALEKVESEQKGREPFCSPVAKTENKQMIISGSHPHDLASLSGNAELDLVQNELNIVPSETPPSSNHSKARSYQKYPCLMLTPTSSQREQRLLERIQEEKFILSVELYKWLESLEKDKPTTLAKKTVTRALNKLQNEGHCKCIHVSVPVVTNCGRSRTTEVVLHKSVQLTPELLGQVHERLRSFDMLSRGQGLARIKNEKSVPVLTGINRIISNDMSDSQAVKAEAMRSNGFVLAKMVRAKLLHNFLWSYLSCSSDWDDALSSGRHGYDLKNPHSTCKLFALDLAIKAMPLELFLQVVGSALKFEDMIESCKRGLCLSDLPVQDYKSLMDTRATGRLSWIIDVLRRLKLIRLVTDGQIEDALLTTLTYAMELKPYIEEPSSRLPLSLGVNSSDLRPRIRHDFILSSKEAVDIYWKTLEYCYATADPSAAVHAFPGSAVHEVFLYRSWASVRVMTADQRALLLKRVIKDDLANKISFKDCVQIARDLNLTLEQVLRVSNDKKQSRLHRFQTDFDNHKLDSQPETSKCRSRKRKKRSKTKSSKHRKSVNRESGMLKSPLSESNCEDTEEENPITTDLEDHDVHNQEGEEEIQAEDGEELGTNGEDQDDNCDFISQCAFPKTTRHSKFVWTEASDRQLVIQYVRYHAELGAKFYRTFWATLPDLPAPPEACRRRMASLKKIPEFRTAIMRLCNLLGFRYVNHLLKSKEKELQFNNGSGNTFQDSSRKKCATANFSDCLERNLESDFEDQMWDDFEDQKVRRALDEVLCCLRVLKAEGGKRAGTSPERHLESQARDFQEQPTTASGEDMQIYGGKRQKRTKCHRLPGKFLKLLNEGISVSRRAYESLAVANAVELLKLVFLSISTAPEVPTLLAETLRRYSEHDLFAAFNYLRQKKFMVGGNGSQPFVLSQQFMHSVSSSPFPVNTGKRASKFASWLSEREKSLMEEGIHLNADLQCGDIFQLLALVSSGELCISPRLPEEGVGDVEEKRNSKRKTYEDEICNNDQAKKPAEGECSTRREKGFPGINVSLIRAVIPRTDCGGVSNNEKTRTCSSRVDENDQSFCTATAIGGDGSFISAKLNSQNDVGDSAASSVTVDESPWKAMADYGEYLMSNLSDEDRVGPLFPEIFQNLHSAILKSGDQGLSMLEISKVAAIRGEKMAELVVDVLQVFGSAVRVNGYDDVHVVNTSFRSKYFLSSADGRYENIKSSRHRKRPRISNDNCLATSQKYWEKDVTNMESDVVHKVTMLNLPEDVYQLSVERQPHEVNVTFQDSAQVRVVSSERQRENTECTMTSSDSHSFRPILPWINGDGTTNHIVYKGLIRRVLGIVMQNPGILEYDVIQQMNTLNPQNCRKLLGLMVLDNHLIVKKMYQTTSAGPPGLLSLFCKSFKKSESIYREHYFANPMSSSLL